MIPLVSSDMNINKFVDIKLPTKRQIFARVGGYSSGGDYSGDNSVRIGLSPTEKADSLVRAAESYNPSSDTSEEKKDE